MNVRVTDGEGQTLAAGRDLDALRRQLGAEAAAAFTAIDDPRWNRVGLSTWDFDELPAEIDVAHGGLTMKAYPALVNGEASVALRLLDSPNRAARETRFALRRLFLLSAGREVKTQVDWLPGWIGRQPVAALIPGFDLRGQLAELLAARAWPDEAELPRTQAAFEAALGAARQRIGLAVQDLTGLVGPWFEAYREARKAFDVASGVPAASKTAPAKAAPVAWGKLALKAAPQAVKWQYAIDDVSDQLSRLAGPKCLSTTPWAWLRHGPRYFRASAFGWTPSLAAGSPRTASALKNSFPAGGPISIGSSSRGRNARPMPELIQYRWMLEEYRVSLFAQKLGTSIPVSPKRLEQQWSKVGRV